MDEFTETKLPYFGKCRLDGFDGYYTANAYGPTVCHTSGLKGYSIESEDSFGPCIWVNVPTCEGRFKEQTIPVFYYS